jgi:hypothetical protein
MHLFHQLDDFIILVASSSPDSNPTPKGYQIRQFSIDLLTLEISKKRIASETIQSILPYICNYLFVDDISVLNFIHNLFLTRIKIPYSDRELIISLFATPTKNYYNESTSEEILILNIKFWNNIINYELSRQQNVPIDYMILFNIAEIIVPLFIESILRRESNINFSNQMTTTQMIAKLTQLFKLIPSILISIYQKILETLIPSNNLTEIPSAALPLYTVYRNNPSNNKEDNL